MSRVLSTQEAKDAIVALRSGIDNDFFNAVGALNRQGQILSNPDCWDGDLARQFRDETWPHVQSVLNKATSDLQELNDSLRQIAENIFAAGGSQY